MTVLAMLTVTVSRSFCDDNAIRYVLPISWIDVMFARNRPGKGNALCDSEASGSTARD